jgi:hypothetical protein
MVADWSGIGDGSLEVYDTFENRWAAICLSFQVPIVALKK